MVRTLVMKRVRERAGVLGVRNVVVATNMGESMRAAREQRRANRCFETKAIHFALR